mmetsp:Transcript_4292/g.6284  ORF Transcript_4292/g.6284 Transcript_4292/m.6284 type:complete len:269 (+) Transcript_4292:65-871(+)
MMRIIDQIQYRLDFKNWQGYPQFSNVNGLGRVALISTLLGSILSTHLLCLAYLLAELSGVLPPTLLNYVSEARIQLILQWMLFVITLCVFHLGEFFVTAMFNPTVVNSSSFVVNHSKAYTIAMLVATTEFWLRFCFFPKFNSSNAAIVGIILVCTGQLIRSLAMKTCGESFNHIIQHSKKDNHKLVTDGIYMYLRHPSYAGFYYWSVGTQLMMGNFITSILFAGASWVFFHRRIPYEEQTLLRLFPDEYPQYMEKTSIGIPFIKAAKK